MPDQPPVIVPVFLPFQGCKGRCVFCDQKAITSIDEKGVSTETIVRFLSDAFSKARRHEGKKVIVAFYGGTFTNNPLPVIRQILAATSSFREKGLFSSIRVSTRPDSLEEEKLLLMKEYGVDTVELGVQSMNDDVLNRAGRGHSSEHTRDAFYLLKSLGFEVGAQLMAGLPGDSPAIFMDSVEEVIALRPSMVRLYPTVVIEGTALAGLYAGGRYTPLGLEETVSLCAQALARFEEEQIQVIRIGLAPSQELIEGRRMIDGPWHPCLGFLVRSRHYLQKAIKSLPSSDWMGLDVRVRVPSREITLLRGFRNQGLSALKAALSAKTLTVTPDDSIARGKLVVEPI